MRLKGDFKRHFQVTQGLSQKHYRNTKKETKHNSMVSQKQEQNSPPKHSVSDISELHKVLQLQSIPGCYPRLKAV